jgi:hypothetical protein
MGTNLEDRHVVGENTSVILDQSINRRDFVVISHKPPQVLGLTCGGAVRRAGQYCEPRSTRCSCVSLAGWGIGVCVCVCRTHTQTHRHTPPHAHACTRTHGQTQTNKGGEGGKGEEEEEIYIWGESIFQPQI